MTKTLDYELLVEKFSRGDETAFDRIVEVYSADIAVLANRLLGWPGDVEDIVQEVLLAAFLGLKKFRCECSLKTWLFTITNKQMPQLPLQANALPQVLFKSCRYCICDRGLR